MTKKEYRPDRYPVEITMKHVGKGETQPNKGKHFVAENSKLMIGAHGEVQLKYWRIDGKIVRENPYIFHITDKDVEIEAFFGAKKLQKQPLKIAENIITKDISATAGIIATHEKDSSKRKRRSL